MEQTVCLRKYAAYGRYAVQIPLAGVLPVHGLQHAVAAALHRQMDMARDVRVFGHHLKGLVAHVFGMRRSEAYPHVGLWARLPG